MSVLDPLKLTQWTSCGGCAAKWGGASLGSLVERLPAAVDPRLLVGLAPFDDAAVYRLGPELAIVSTTDFFPPLVDDPSDFGAIAAANACSDVFAMGARVILALNVAAFPEQLPPEVVTSILAAAAEVVAAAGGTVAGGHTIRSDEPIFGLAVQGTVHPDRIWTKGAARVGDRLVLSKPIGTGIVLAGSDERAKTAVIAGMRVLNRQAAERLAALPDRSGRPGAHGVTDVTGFGLAGHAWELAERSGVAVRLDSACLPLYDGARAAADAGVRTGGDARNRAYLGSRFAGGDDAVVDALAMDPQTSGGLLASVSPQDATSLAADGWWEVGEVVDGQPGVSLV